MDTFATLPKFPNNPNIKPVLLINHLLKEKVMR